MWCWHKREYLLLLSCDQLLRPLHFHTCVWTRLLCILNSKRMLVHAFAWSKTMKNISNHWPTNFFLRFSSCVSHEVMFYNFQCFSSFSTMRMHAQAFICWSKCTTHVSCWVHSHWQPFINIPAKWCHKRCLQLWFFVQLNLLVPFEGIENCNAVSNFSLIVYWGGRHGGLLYRNDYSFTLLWNNAVIACYINCFYMGKVV